jgi:GTP-binding protein
VSSEEPIHAKFITSSPDYAKCPDPVKPEYAFLGRSNVGKSSLINMITRRKMLAKTSSTPGKTQLINHFLINEEWYLVDLPGYGYARASKTSRKKWLKVIEGYLLKRTNLMSTFLLIDSRNPFQDNDREVMNWFGENRLPFTLVFTKSDKLTLPKLKANLDAIKEAILSDWEEFPPSILSSSVTGLGRDEILAFIGQTNKLFTHPSR